MVFSVIDIGQILFLLLRFSLGITSAAADILILDLTGTASHVCKLPQVTSIGICPGPNQFCSDSSIWFLSPKTLTFPQPTFFTYSYSSPRFQGPEPLISHVIGLLTIMRTRSCGEVTITTPSIGRDQGILSAEHLRFPGGISTKRDNLISPQITSLQNCFTIFVRPTSPDHRCSHPGEEGLQT